MRLGAALGQAPPEPCGTTLAASALTVVAYIAVYAGFDALSRQAGPRGGDLLPVAACGTIAGATFGLIAPRRWLTVGLPLTVGVPMVVMVGLMVVLALGQSPGPGDSFMRGFGLGLVGAAALLAAQRFAGGLGRRLMVWLATVALLVGIQVFETAAHRVTMEETRRLVAPAVEGLLSQEIFDTPGPILWRKQEMDYSLGTGVRLVGRVSSPAGFVDLSTPYRKKASKSGEGVLITQLSVLVLQRRPFTSAEVHDSKVVQANLIAMGLKPGLARRFRYNSRGQATLGPIRGADTFCSFNEDLGRGRLGTRVTIWGVRISPSSRGG